jgi:autotransporter-associated beta strand protein
MGNTGLLVFGNNVVMKSTSVADFTVVRPVRFDGNAAFGEETTRTGTLVFEGDADLNGAVRTITVSNPVTKWTEFKGTLSNGGLTKAGAGLLVLSGTNVYAGGTTVNAGTLQGTTDSLPGNIANNAALVFDQTADGTYAGVLSGNGTVTKNGAGTLTLSGANLHAGLTIINEGLLAMVGSAADSAHLVGGGAHLMGAGAIGELIVDGTVHPGASSNAVGTLHVADVFLSPGGALRFDVSQATGTPGTHWDLVDSSGGITVDATERAPFTVQVVGAPLGFDSSPPWSWKFLDAADGAVNGFAAYKFATDTSDFTSDMGGGAFVVTESGGDLFLEFQIPGVAVLGTNFATIANGDATPAAADGTDFGNVSIGGAELRTFYVTNTGGAALSLGDVAIGGADAGDFVVVATNDATVAAGDVAPFSIAYSPSDLGASAAMVYLTNGVSASSPYTFALAGTGLIAGPTNLLVRNDGYEMIRLSWNKAAAFDVMIVHRANAAPTDPTQETLYAVARLAAAARCSTRVPRKNSNTSCRRTRPTTTPCIPTPARTSIRRGRAGSTTPSRSSPTWLRSVLLHQRRRAVRPQRRRGLERGLEPPGGHGAGGNGSPQPRAGAGLRHRTRQPALQHGTGRRRMGAGQPGLERGEQLVQHLRGLGHERAVGGREPLCGRGSVRRGQRHPDAVPGRPARGRDVRLGAVRGGRGRGHQQHPDRGGRGLHLHPQVPADEQPHALAGLHHERHHFARTRQRTGRVARDGQQ